MRIDSDSFARWAVGLALVTTVLAIAAKNMVVDLDLFHEMALARQAWELGAMPKTDAFAYVPTQPIVVHHEWATGAVLYLICVLWGWGAAGLVFTKYLLTAGVCGGCYLYARRLSIPFPLFATLAPLALNVGGWMAFTNIRAQLFTLLCLVIMFHLLEIDRQGKRWWIAIWLPLVVVWGNLHGGVVSGICLIGLYGIGRVLQGWQASGSIATAILQQRHLILTGLATAGALNISPYGWDYVPYLIRAIRMPRPLIPEWNPIWDLETYDALIFFSIAVAISLGAWLADWRRWNQHRRPGEGYDWFVPLALLFTAYMAAKHYRHGSLYAVTWICLVPPLLQATLLRGAIDDLFRRYAMAIGTAGIAIAVLTSGLAIQSQFWKLRVPAQRRYTQEPVLLYPVGPVDYLAQQGLEVNLFVPFNLGAYVSWKRFPAVKVSIDSRYEVAYPAGALEDNLRFYHALPGWEAIPSHVATDAILIPVSAAVLEPWRERQRDPDAVWQCRYRDDEFELWFRTEFADKLPLSDRRGEYFEGVFP